MSVPDVVVAWSAGRPSEALRDLLAGTVRERLTGLAGPVRLSHLCPRCGSDRHGRPRLPGQPELGLSVAHAERVSAVAGVVGAQVGIDLESEDDPRFGSVASVLLHPRETGTDPRLLARTWVRKESVLKALGTGLAADPRSVELGAPAAAPMVVQLPAPFEDVPVALRDVDLGTGTIGALAVVGRTEPRVSVSEVAAEARAR